MSASPWVPEQHRSRNFSRVPFLALAAHLLAAAGAPVHSDTLLAMSMSDPSFTGVSAGGELGTDSEHKRMSHDGRWIVFRSRGVALLVPGYTGSGPQILLSDRLTGTVRLVSAAAGASDRGGDGDFHAPVISPDGRFVTFATDSTNLIAGAPAETRFFNVYVWDRDAPPESALLLVSHTPAGAVQRGNDHSGVPAISADGRYVSFLSFATDLVTESSEKGDEIHIYFWDRNSPPSAATRLVSHAASSETLRANGSCFGVSLSDDGRYATYSSSATNLISDASGGTGSNVYVWDREAAPPVANRLVSHTPTGPSTRANGQSHDPRLSAAGRFVVFTSYSSDLIAGGTGASGYNVYLWDAEAAVPIAIRLVSHTPAAATVRAGGSGGGQHMVSADGRYVTFQSSSDLLIAGWTGELDRNVYQWDRDAPVAIANRLVSHSPVGATVPGGGASYEPAASVDGRYVIYRSDAEDLSGFGFPPPPPTDVYLWDREAPFATANRLVSHTPGSKSVGGNGNSDEPAISGSGAVVAFTSEASDLVAGDTYFRDVFASDSSALEVELVSAKSDEIPWPPMTGNSYSSISYWGGAALSADGRYSIFVSSATDLLPVADEPPWGQLYLWDAATRKIRLVTHTPESATMGANSGAAYASLSANGRYVVYRSEATDLLMGASGGTGGNIYFWDRDVPAASATRLVSHTPLGATTRGNESSEKPVLSADGRYVAYASLATDLVAGSGGEDGLQLYLWDRDAPTAGANRLVSHTPGGATTRADKDSEDPRISVDGRFVSFWSAASDLVFPPEVTIVQNVYLWDRDAQPDVAMRLVSHTPASATIRAGNHSYESAISANGRYVAFRSMSAELIPNYGGGHDANVYLWDRFAPTATAIRLVSHRPAALPIRGNGVAYLAAISADGRFVSFVSDSTDLIAGATGGTELNVYLWDRDAGPFEANRLVSHTPAGVTVRANKDSGGSTSMSADLRYVIFESSSSDLVAGEAGATGPGYSFQHSGIRSLEFT